MLFEDRLLLIEYLIGMEILTRGGSGTSVGFSHQTLFEHAWARAFARQKSRLSDYAVARQNGLFIRPTVWASLNYLRGADPAAYREEFSRLWSRFDLRSHLRHLLIEFLGTVSLPDDQEQAWLFGTLLNPSLRSRALASIRGNRDWFHLMAERHLPVLMQDNSVNSSLLVGILTASLPRDRDTCLSLLREQWASHPEKAILAFSVLTNLTDWDEESAGLANQVIHRGRINRSSVIHLASEVQTSAPDLAPRVVATVFERELQELESEPDPPPDQLPEDATETDRYVNRMTHRPRRRFERLVDDLNGWDGVEEIAGQAPRAFLREVWPLFKRTLGWLVRDMPGGNQFRRYYTLGLELPAMEKEHVYYPLAQAIDCAVCEIAVSSPDEFIAFLNQNRGVDCDTVQRYLARGLIAGVSTLAPVAFQFLIEEPRRFALGPHSDEHQETVSLLQALATHLTDDQVRQLEEAILDWDWIEVDSQRHNLSDRFNIQKSNRRRRLRLLNALPRERLCEAISSLIGKEEYVFPDRKEAGIHRIKGGYIGSPMSADQMKRARDKHIVGLFLKLHDKTYTSYPNDFLRGGSVQASREFEKFAQAEPERTVRIIASFNPGQQERPAGSALMGIAKSNYPNEDIFRLILDLDAKGFSTEEFRVDASRALEDRARKPGGLPDEICKLLERWLANSWTIHEQGQQSEHRRQTGPLSVLWGSDRIVAIPSGTHTLLQALTLGYLLRNPIEPDRWLAVLTAHVERVDDAETWRILSRNFADLRFCARVAAIQFVHRLFERFPTVLASDYGPHLVTQLWYFAPSEAVWSWLDLLRHGTWECGRQAFGELVVLLLQVFPNDARAQIELSAFVTATDGADDDLIEERIGVALASAHLWEESEARTFATHVLTQLLPTAGDRVAAAAMGVLGRTRKMDPDKPTHALLKVLVSHPRIVRFLSDGEFVEQLANLLPNEAEPVFRICRELVRLRQRELGSIQSGWASASSHMTNIAITLQRMEGQLRDFGVELFESLIEGGVADAEGALQEIDQRLPTPLNGTFPRPRRPSRRRR